MAAVRRIPARFPVRAGDKGMYKMGRHGSDALIRAVITLDGHTNVERLRRALRLSLDAVPIAGCEVVEHHEKPRFERLANLDQFELLQVVVASSRQEAEKALADYALESFEPYGRPLVEAAIIREAQRDVICFRLHHVLCDGGGTIDYLMVLSDIYAHLEQDPGYVPTPNTRGDRGMWQVLKHFGWKELHEANQPPPFMRMFEAGWRLEMPYGEDGAKALVVRELPAGRLATIRTFAHTHGATVNDVLLAAWYRAIYRLTQPEPGTSLSVPTHVNLRRHLPGGKANAVANLSSMALSSIGAELGETLADTTALVHADMEQVKNKPPFLGMMTFHLMPPAWQRREMEKRMRKMPRRRPGGMGVPMFNNIGRIDPARLGLGAPAVNGYLTACVPRAGDSGIQVVITTCGSHVNMAIVMREIKDTREILDTLLDGFEEELAATDGK